jgi:hypothetical protein
MPRCVRNFWIDLQVDGRQSDIMTGPRRSDGGFDMYVYIRNRGAVEQLLRIKGQCVGSDSLELCIADGEGRSVATYTRAANPPPRVRRRAASAEREAASTPLLDS